MSDQRARVEIFVPAYNAETFLRPSLDSIVAQTYQDREITLSNDCSKDSTPAIAAEYGSRGVKIRNMETPSKGLFLHLNRLLPELSKDYVGFFHADDVYDPTILEKQIAFLDANPDVDSVITAGIAIDAEGRKLWDIFPPESMVKRGGTHVFTQKELMDFLLQFGNSFLICPSGLFRRGIFEKTGPFRADMPNAGDLEMWLRILFTGKLAIINEPLIQYRFSTAQISQKYQAKRLGESDFFRAMDLYVEQHRARLGISEQVMNAYEGLRCLDAIHVGLNQLGFFKESVPLEQAMKKSKSPELSRMSETLGFVDRLKVRGARAILPLAKTPVGPGLARMWLKQTDLQSGGLLRVALRAKRMLKPV